ncbi:hypothetical protein [Vreelandella lionensis]|uniref:hypothetical protein n=1 Tax=Vreelandella lionensis TaxID=1144478 RepID=UPI00111C5433|nr:hypothetical protein [Halomonas lionensis]
MKGQETAPPPTGSPSPISHWGQHYYLQIAPPMLRLQLIWIESMTQAMQLEADLFHAITHSNITLVQCLTQNRKRCTHAELNEHYQALAKTLADAHADRIAGVTQLSNDFRRCLWEEI